MSLRSAKYVNKPQEAHVKESNKKEHGKKHAKETSRSQWQKLVRLLALETSPTEAIVEDEEREVNTMLMEGLEQAIHRKEAAIEAYPAYVPDTATGEDAQARAQVAHQIARTDAVTAAAEECEAENKRLYRMHCEALKALEEWRRACKHRARRSEMRTIDREFMTMHIEATDQDQLHCHATDQEVRSE